MKQRVSKTLSYMLVLLVMVGMFTTLPVQTAAALDLEAESAILVDAETGKVLYAKNPDEKLPPASMTKMMTEYLVLEAIHKDEISWETTIQVSDYAYDVSANPGFSGIGLRQDVDYNVRELYEAMAIYSDNATTIMLGELIAGSEGEFVKLMNKKGEEMGLTDFEFVNTTGLENADLGENYPEGTDPDGINYLSARSSALLAYHLINDYPESLEISSIPETDFDEQTIVNWNRMLPHEGTNFKQFHYEGVDGLKTGQTDLAGFCFTGTAERSGKRLITVVMKTDSEEQRFKETAKLLDYGYEKFESEEIFPAGYQLEGQETLPVIKGKEKTVKITTNQSFQLPVKENQSELFEIKYHFDKKYVNKDGELTAPIEKGQKIGRTEIIYTGKDDYGYITPESNQKKIDIVTAEEVEKSNWLMIALGAISDFFVNIFTTIVDMVKGWF